MKTKAELPLITLVKRKEETSEPAKGGEERKEFPPFVAAYFELNHLKQLYRQGWLRRGIPPERCESVAEHVYGMAMLGGWIAEAHFPELDRDKILRMTLVHELGEIYTGDLMPSDGVPLVEKQRLEREGLRLVVEKLPNGASYLDLWEEFEAGQTPEARFVRQLDRLEMAFQAAVYETQGFGDLSEFFTTTDAVVVDPKLREIYEGLKSIRG